MYRELDCAAIVHTAERLSRRVGERFPGSGLSRVSLELLAVAREAEANLAALRRPNWWIRGGVGLCLVLITAAVVGLFATADLPDSGVVLFDLLAVLESAINDFVFIGIAVFFLLSLEMRSKRARALSALHELRSLAHVIDMHQLTKDPQYLLAGLPATASSPERTMTRYQLARYLDYCTEMLSILSKLGALYMQDLADELVMNAANDVQSLTGTLSSKIWQKIVLVNAEAGAEAVVGQPVPRVVEASHPDEV